MKNTLSLAFCSLFVASSIQGIEVGTKPDTPKLPDSDYVVHDGTRPQPRQVKTAGAVSVQAPADAKVLFDGTNLDAWNGAWEIKDGVMVATGPKGIGTKEKFGDIQLHIEFRVPAGREVSGQKGGNSGIYLMGKYEVQVQESHTNKTYPDGQAAAMYGQYPPLVNPATPQGEWQSYDIIFEAPVYKDGKNVEPAYLTVLFNGVVVHHRKAYQGPSTHKKLTSYPDSHPEKGPIHLQWHSDPIEFRNIWVRELGDYDEGGE